MGKALEVRAEAVEVGEEVDRGHGEGPRAAAAAAVAGVDYIIASSTRAT